MMRTVEEMARRQRRHSNGRRGSMDAMPPDEQRLDPLAGRLVRDALASARKQLRAEAHLAARLVAAALTAAIGPPQASPSEPDAAKAAETSSSRRHQRTSAAPPWSLLPACCAVV
ncbi:uncharacterized protein LOC119165584 [Rhipicephalus microplus]|uniref:uncharacterized protein LOC119165584 n=1 Tax=Rhipicephalus microplus TaxID=6941 RepID=UPI003F6CEE17